MIDNLLQFLSALPLHMFGNIIHPWSPLMKWKTRFTVNTVMSKFVLQEFLKTVQMMFYMMNTCFLTNIHSEWNPPSEQHLWCQVCPLVTKTVRKQFVHPYSVSRSNCEDCQKLWEPPGAYIQKHLGKSDWLKGNKRRITLSKIHVQWSPLHILVEV